MNLPSLHTAIAEKKIWIVQTRDFADCIVLYSSLIRIKSARYVLSFLLFNLKNMTIQWKKSCTPDAINLLLVNFCAAMITALFKIS